MISHARLVIEALAAGKHVFVEKPLALTADDIDTINSAYRGVWASDHAPRLMIGFNRRFAPQVVRMKALLDARAGPKSMIMTVNAGAIPAEHWTQDPDVGGGRVIGEACHFIDLLRHLAGSPIASCHRQAMASETGDTVSLALYFADGSLGTIHYFANGDKAFPKERLEAFAGGQYFAARRLPFAHRLRLEGVPGDEPLASGQGPEGVRRGVPRRNPQWRTGPDPL